MKHDADRKRIFNALDAIWEDTLRLTSSGDDKTRDRISGEIDEIVNMVLKITVVGDE